jgi:hypothetical protein
VKVIATAVLIARTTDFHDPYTLPWSARCALNTWERIRPPADAGVG